MRETHGEGRQREKAERWGREIGREGEGRWKRRRETGGEGRQMGKGDW